MRKLPIIIATITLLFALFLSCNKEEGQGGTSTIRGKVFIIDLNAAGDTVAQYYAPDENVFILYGDKDLTYDDDFSTSFDGSYQFSNLTQGNYTIFAYSKCSSCAGGIEAVKKTVEIAANKKVVEVEDLIIID